MTESDPQVRYRRAVKEDAAEPISEEAAMLLLHANNALVKDVNEILGLVDGKLNRRVAAAVRARAQHLIETLPKAMQAILELEQL